MVSIWTLATIATIVAFSVPAIYIRFQKEIDQGVSSGVVFAKAKVGEARVIAAQKAAPIRAKIDEKIAPVRAKVDAKLSPIRSRFGRKVPVSNGESTGVKPFVESTEKFTTFNEPVTFEKSPSFADVPIPATQINGKRSSQIVA